MSQLVLIRHGQSQWNLENRFTGWVDVPLSKKGIDEAIAAGKKLKGMRFDAGYVSHMLRAVQTLHYVLLKSTILEPRSSTMRSHASMTGNITPAALPQSCPSTSP